MDYNAGYDVSYYGYHYDTGCIDFSKEKWVETFNKRKNENIYFAYIQDPNIDEFVGYVNYQYNENDDRYECGILIDSKHRGMGYSKDALKLLCDEARKNEIKELYDNFEVDRGNTLNIFKQVGFEVVQEITWKKFGKDVMDLVSINELNFGNIICSCNLVDCIEMTDEFIEKIKKNKNEYVCGIYENGRYAWILDNIQVLNNPIPAKGHLGIWNMN